MNSQAVVFCFSLFLILVGITQAVLTEAIYYNRPLLPEAECGLSFRSRIMGGEESQFQEFPWSALIQYSHRLSNKTFFGCGGVLITAKYVLTAAHCTKKETIPKRYRVSMVRLGEWDMSKDIDCHWEAGITTCNEPVQDIEVERITRRVEYNPGDPAQNNDIALIRLRKSVVFNDNVVPICIPLDSLINKTYEGDRLESVGWGITLNGQGPTNDIQLNIILPVVESDSCSEKSGSKLSSTQMCAGGGLERGSCFGDSGGPLIQMERVDTLRYHVIGVLSIRPETCGKEAGPAVYTMVGPHVEWIMDHLLP